MDGCDLVSPTAFLRLCCSWDCAAAYTHGVDCLHSCIRQSASRVCARVAKQRGVISTYLARGELLDQVRSSIVTQNKKPQDRAIRDSSATAGDSATYCHSQRGLHCNTASCGVLQAVPLTKLRPAIVLRPLGFVCLLAQSNAKQAYTCCICTCMCHRPFSLSPALLLSCLSFSSNV